MKVNNKTGFSRNKKIWIDLDNSPHVVFFRPIIKELQNHGYKVFVTVRKCFQTCGLAERCNIPYTQIGIHYGKNKLLKILGTFFRSFMMISFVLKNKPAIALSHGSRSQLLTAKITGIPSIMIFDYEHAKKILGINATWLIIPDVIPASAINFKNIYKYPGIKEDVYVPEYKPDPTIRDELGIKKNELIVTIRPPANEAHYHNYQSEVLFKEVIEFLKGTPDLRMVLLPRNEKQEEEIKNFWPEMYANGKIIIPDHVVDGLNLIWYSDLVISGGGTMNREAAALGVPVYSIFRGKIGAVDKYLASEGRLSLIESVNDIHTKIQVTRRDKSNVKNCTNTDTKDFVVNAIISIVEKYC